MPSTDDPSAILEEAVGGAADRPECQIDGCSRPGTVPKRISDPDSGDGVADHYVCRYHYRLFQGIRAGLVVVLVALLLFAFFRPV